MLRIGASLLLLLQTSILAAQPVAHPLAASPGDARATARPPVLAPDTVDVLVLMVQFREDTDNRTSGNGLFDLRTIPDPIIDPPPRNAEYFRQHLQFLEYYYRKSSRGLVVVRPTLVEPVVSLDRLMAEFSPPRGSSNRPVGDLAVAGWRAADSLGLVPDFSLYDCFIIFHAGVGRDIDLIALLGYDPTPLDIPSLYIGPSAFREFYGQDFAGIPVNGGSFLITNTIVMPETETRTLPGVTGDVTLELGINGLLCASFGNFLGLPDLFDTGTGRSGIGRFGLMDGQGIFSYFGVFPPEPSAWEKSWLGWITPHTLGSGTHTVRLPAVSASDTVYRVPISAQEYYLVENRNRDPLRNGQTVTAVVQGQTVVRTFARDTAGFSSFDISALEGSIVEVEDLDWSLPGGVSQEGEFFDGGILIWHIDETAIAQGLRGTGVNSNPARKGVRVLEADGSQDIGEEYGFLSPGSGSEDGTPLDYWYEGNASPLYRGTFDATSQPQAISNSGAYSHVSIREFSVRDPVMTAAIQVGDSATQPVSGFPLRLAGRLAAPALTVEQLVSNGPPSLIVSTTDAVYAWGPDGLPAMPGGRTDGRVLAANGTLETAATAADLDGDGVTELLLVEHLLPGRQGGLLRVVSARDGTADSLADEVVAYNHVNRLTSVPAVGDELVAVGADAGRAVVVTRSGLPVDSSRVNGGSDADPITGVAVLPAPWTFCFLSDSGFLSVVSYESGRAQILAERRIGERPAGPPAAARFGGAWGGALRIVVTSGGWIHVFDSLLSPVPGFPVPLRGAALGSSALADLNGDGARDFIVCTSAGIEACNLAGASLDYFPVVNEALQPVSSAPVVADITGDGAPEVVAATEDGVVLAYDARGRMAPGFPVQAGTGTHAVALWAVQRDIILGTDLHVAVASSDTSAVSAWRTGATAGPVPAGAPEPWSQYQADARRTGFGRGVPAGTPVSQAFFPAERAYNWPNPVYDGKTYLRYYVAADATVTIRILDLAGDLVTEFTGPGVGGMDNEATWDVGDVQSGIYFARIEASGNGASGVAVVKVAVVK